MFVSSLFAAVLLAPPADPPAEVRPEPWADRTGPTLTIENFRGPLVMEPVEPLTVVVRVEPFIPEDVTVRLLLKQKPAETEPAETADRLKQVIAADAFPRYLTPGEERWGHAPPTTDLKGRPGYAAISLWPPDGGWPTGAGELRVEVHGFEYAALARAAYIGRNRELWRRLGIAPPALKTTEPAEDGPVLDLDAAVAALDEAPDGPALTLAPNERFELRGTFRSAPVEDDRLPGPQISSEFHAPRQYESNGLTYAFPEGEPDADGAAPHWFRQIAYAPDTPGTYRLEVERFNHLRPGDALFPPLTVDVRPPDVRPTDDAGRD